jgi:GNAT superfamily N-acetyltransferase
MWVARLPPDDSPQPSVDMDGNPTGQEDIVGSVLLAFHVAPNGRFRTEVRKLLVDERYQRRGIGRTLMLQLEDAARAHGSTLCVSCKATSE